MMIFATTPDEIADEFLEKAQEYNFNIYARAQHNWTCDACGENHAIHRINGYDLKFVNSNTGDGWYFCEDLKYGKCDCGKPVPYWDKDGNYHEE